MTKLSIFVTEKKFLYDTFPFEKQTHNIHLIRKSAPKWSHYIKAPINRIPSISCWNNRVLRKNKNRSLFRCN